MSHWKFIWCGSGSNGCKLTSDACEQHYPSVSPSLILCLFSTHLPLAVTFLHLCTPRAFSLTGERCENKPEGLRGKRVAFRADERDEWHSPLWQAAVAEKKKQNTLKYTSEDRLFGLVYWMGTITVALITEENMLCTFGLWVTVMFYFDKFYSGVFWQRKKLDKNGDSNNINVTIKGCKLLKTVLFGRERICPLMRKCVQSIMFVCICATVWFSYSFA